MIRWIASYPKSGNTWVRLFLGAYIGSPEHFNPDLRLRGHLQDTDPGYTAKVSPKPLTEMSPEENYAVRGAALVHMIHDFGAPYVKTHCANITLDWQDNLVPVALTEKAVYLIRDPRDVVVSYADHSGKTIDETIKSLADERNMVQNMDGTGSQPLTSWSRHVQSWTRQMPFPVFATTYEALSQDPRGTFTAMLRFLGIPVTEQRLRLALERTSFKALQRAEEQDGFAARSRHQKRFFRAGTVGGWRDVLTDKQRSQIELDHREAMDTWHYLGAEENVLPTA